MSQREKKETQYLHTFLIRLKHNSRELLSPLLSHPLINQKRKQITKKIHYIKKQIRIANSKNWYFSNKIKTIQPNLLIKKARSYYLLISPKIDVSVQKLMDVKEPPKQLHFFLNLFVICFLSFCILSVSNPFYLFLPSASFPIPKKDTRKEITFYVFSYKQNKLIPVKRKFTQHNDLTMRLRLLSALVSNPITSARNIEAQTFIDLTTLPLLGNAIRHVWKAIDKKIIVDMSLSAIQQEFTLFQKDRNRQQKINKNNNYLDTFFIVLTKNLFHLEKDIETIEFWTDGEKKHIADMQQLKLSTTLRKSSYRNDSN